MNAAPVLLRWSLLLLFSWSALAQEAPPMSLEEAQALAKKSAPSLKIARERLAQAELLVDKAWVMTRRRRRFHRSARTPPSGASRKVGSCPAKPTSPRRKADPVKRYTSQLVAMRVNQVPTREIPWPAKKRRKFLWRRARRVCFSFNAVGVKVPNQVSVWQEGPPIRGKASWRASSPTGLSGLRTISGRPS